VGEIQEITRHPFAVIPAKAGIFIYQSRIWLQQVPAFAGVTGKKRANARAMAIFSGFSVKNP
jgi:hypothetical protein